MIIIDFLVMDCLSIYNAVIRKPTLKALKAITSIYHLMMKFPTPEEIGYIHGSQFDLRECYNQSVRMGSDKKRLSQTMMVESGPPSKGLVESDSDPRVQDEKRIFGPVKELVDIKGYNRKPIRILKVGKCLEQERFDELAKFLQENLNVFTWRHKDMVSKPWCFVMCHHLNSDPERKRVRPKRRAMNSERYNTLEEEVASFSRLISSERRIISYGLQTRS